MTKIEEKNLSGEQNVEIYLTERFHLKKIGILPKWTTYNDKIQTFLIKPAEVNLSARNDINVYCELLTYLGYMAMDMSMYVPKQQQQSDRESAKYKSYLMQ